MMTAGDSASPVTIPDSDSRSPWVLAPLAARAARSRLPPWATPHGIDVLGIAPQRCPLDVALHRHGNEVLAPGEPHDGLERAQQT